MNNKIDFEKAQRFLLDQLKFNLQFDFKQIDVLVKLYWINRILDSGLVSEEQYLHAVNIVESLENSICIPEICDTDNTESLLLETSDCGCFNKE